MIKRKRLLAAGTAAVLSFTVAACGDDSESTTTTAEAASDDTDAAETTAAGADTTAAAATTEAAADTTEAAADTTAAAATTEAAAATTEAAAETTEAAAETTEAAAETTEAAAETTEAATDTTEAAADTTEAAADTTEAATDTTEAAAETTEAGTETTEASTDTTEAVTGTTEATTGSTGAGTDTTTATGDTTTGTAAGGEMTVFPAVESPAVGLLFDITGRGDRSFNDSAAAGLDQAEESLGATGAESTPTSDSDRAERVAALVDQGQDLVIGIGFLWQPDLQAAAIENPDQAFALVDSVAVDADGNPLPNVADLTFAEEQGSFLVGVAAALKTQSDHVGFIGGVETDLIKKFEAGFVAGVEAVNPDITVDVQYITQPPDFNGFNDPASGKEIAASMYDDGADVIYAAAGGSGLGMFEAASEAGEPGEFWGIGVDSDQYNLVDEALKPYVLTSMLKNVDVAVFESITALTEGTFEGGIQVYDLEAGGVGYSTSGGFVDDIADQIDEYAAQIISGEIEVPTAP